MITGHCTSGARAQHAKCPDPGRCTCICHIATNAPGAPIDRGYDQGPLSTQTRPFACTACPSTFGDQAGLDHHVATIHTAPVEEPTVTTRPAPPTGPFICECGREFSLARGLSRHRNRARCDENGTTPPPIV